MRAIAASNAAGRDFEELNSGQNDTVSVGVADVSTVDLLLGAYNGTSFNITFAGSGGASETFNNVYVPDFNGGTVNTSGSDTNSVGTFTDQTLFRTTDVGAGGSGNSSNGAYNNYDLTEVSFALAGPFSNQSLNSFDISGNGYMTLLLGATVLSPAVTPAPESSTLALFGVMTVLGGFGLLLAKKNSPVAND